MSARFHLNNPESNATIFSLHSLSDSKSVSKTKRTEGYKLLLIEKGTGKLIADLNECIFSGSALMCFSPHQPYKITGRKLEGYELTFHPDFLCVYKHHKEVACNGVLFDNIYQTPVLSLTSEDLEGLKSVLVQMRNELANSGLARNEVIVALLKIFLITATRIKINAHPSEEEKLMRDKDEPMILLRLKEAIEKHFRTRHSAGEYARLLNISTKSLSRLTKNHFNRKLSDMITDRILIEAKRELYLTSKTVKEIAGSLGFKDEFYFSRLFKNKSKVSPQRYRDTIGAAKAEL